MPYCPKCRDEFQDWVKVCPDDKVALVAELPPLPQQAKKPKEPLVRIVTAPNEMIAKMWEDILKEQGISGLLSTGSSALASSSTVVNMPIRMYVLASESRRAMEILAPFLEK